MSGLNQQFAKLSYLITGTGGSNPPLSARKSHKSLQTCEIFFISKNYRDIRQVFFAFRKIAITFSPRLLMKSRSRESFTSMCHCNQVIKSLRI